MVLHPLVSIVQKQSEDPTLPSYSAQTLTCERVLGPLPLEAQSCPDEQEQRQSPRTQSDWPPSLVQLTELLENKVKIFQKTVSTEEQVTHTALSSDHCDRLGSLKKHIAQSQELSSHLTDLQRRTEQEVALIYQQLKEVRHQQDRLSLELRDLEAQRTESETLIQGTLTADECTVLVQVQKEVQENILRSAEQAERLRFQEEALSTLHVMLGEDLQRYQVEAQRLQDLSDKVSNGMEGENEHTEENSMGAVFTEARGISGSKMQRFISLLNGHATLSSKYPGGCKTNANSKTFAGSEDGARARITNRTVPLVAGSKLRRAGSVKDLIQKFSGSENGQTSPTGSAASSPVGSPGIGGGSGTNVERSSSNSELIEVTKGTLDTSTTSLSNGDGQQADGQGPLPIRVTSPVRGSQTPQLSTDSSSESKGGLPNGSLAGNGTGSESQFDPSKQPESPLSEEETPNSKVRQNPKYQLFLGSDVIGNGSRDPDGTAGGSGPRNSRWESGNSRYGPNHRGSLESLASRDWDTMSDRMGGFESPPRVYNSPYANASMDYSPSRRISEYKNVMSPATREAAPSAFSMRPGLPNKRDFIEELTKQLDTSQKRNQFLEAESIEMDKERNQIRFEMRALMVNNADLVRDNSQLQMEMKRMNERMMEMERENQIIADQYRHLESEMKEAREVMVEANTQEYAFNFLQQSLKNKILDAEDALEKQTEQVQMISEKLWLAEREVEELSMDKHLREKKAGDLSTSVARLEMELEEALQECSQVKTELSLHQKLKDETEVRVDELEESLMEKSQELQRAQQIINKLQGEVSGKLIDKERTLEEEIQLRERAQLQCKQAERTLEDLLMEMETVAQSKEDLVKQLKQAQEKMIDLESDLEEMNDNELRWASKNKRAIEQIEQLQLKLLQQKDLNEQLDCEKAVLERQIRDLRVEVQELQNTRVQEEVITKAEGKVKELEGTLRAEERNKMVLTNNIGKLERRIIELSDQMEEEHRLATEQKDLMTQRIRSLKRQLNETEEEASRKDTQHRHTQRELAEERESSSRLQRQLLDQHLKMKRNESLTMRQTLDNLRLDLSVDDEDVPEMQAQSNKA
ncbi:hypothetical protein AAFF_G00373370 [Aldrovandia affinis]|uniref:Myosin tail domain-containing protein n=1 Tax=Aldrovandia affinis TaxID=143900 RepID=A0AAD7WMA1_9TELE|nr:hypothetical protein AAFF_G00373370 [Aldrovandia affinis]